MKRLGFLIFGVMAYGIFSLTFLYLIAFLADVPAIPYSVDRPATTMSARGAILVDVALIAIFAFQHSGMARQSFKAFWTRYMPQPIERSGYLIFTCLALVLLFTCWQALPIVVWDLRGGIARALLWAMFGAGWLVVMTSTYLINHFEMFGLSQVWAHWRSVSLAAPRFRQPLFYKLVRHPLYSGFMLAFWSTPTMTYGHLLFAAAMSVYIWIAIDLEERDLVAAFGEEYEAYRGKVGRLFPGLK